MLSAALSSPAKAVGWPKARQQGQRQADHRGGTPVDSVGAQPHRAARPRRLLAPPPDADLAQARDTDAQREAPGGMPAHVDGAIGMAWDQRHRGFRPMQANIMESINLC
jgi:hypothetical protein